MSRSEKTQPFHEKIQRYVKEHKLDEVMSATVNAVIRQLPDSPFEQFVKELDKLGGSPPKFSQFRLDPCVARSEMRFDVLMEFRGAQVRTHSLSLGQVLFDGDPGESFQETLAFLKSFFSSAFSGRCVDEFLCFHELCAGLVDAPLPDGRSLDLCRATAAITDELLIAAAQSLDMSRLDFLQHLLLRANLSEFVSPPLRGPDDISIWRSLWPRIAMPVFHGGGKSIIRPASLRCCAAITPFAAGDGAMEDCPSLGWVMSLVQRLREAGSEAVKGLESDKATKDLAVNGVPYCHPGGLVKTMQLTQKAVETAVGTGNESEISGVLWAAADEAWIEEESVYEIETGKKLSLEQLVDFYVELAESDWLTLIVQPFRQDDLRDGCSALREKLCDRKADLRLVFDFGQTDALPGWDEARDGVGECYFDVSCALRVTESVPSMLQKYVKLAPLWQEAQGCDSFAIVDSQAARMVPSVLAALLALRQNKTVFFSHDVADADVTKMSERVDEVLYRVIFPDEDAVTS